MTFEPLISPIFGSTALSFLVFIATLIGVIYFLTTKKVSKHYRNILSLLLFFACMMSLGSAFFGYFFGERIGTVHIGNSSFETPYGAIAYEDISNIVIKKESKNKSMLTPSVGTDYENRLLIISKTIEYYFFSAMNYPINKMIGPMRDAWEKATKKGTSN